MRITLFINAGWLIACWIVCTGYETGYAEEISEVYTLDTLVVTGERLAEDYQVGDVDIGLTPVSCSVVDRTSFEGRLENVSDCIEREVGVQIRESGGIGSFSSITLRGASSEQITVYLDGILLNDASGGGFDLSRLSLSDVDALEIYRGVTPLNLGNPSIGGAVNIRTLRSTPGTSGSIRMGGGSFDTYRFSAIGNHRSETAGYIFSAEALTTQNDFSFKNDNGTTWNTKDDKTEDRNNADVDQLNLLAKAGWDSVMPGRLDLAYQYFDKEQGLPARDNSAAANTRLDIRRHVTTLQWTREKGLFNDGDIRMRLNYVHKNECYDDSEGHVGLGVQKTEYRNRRYAWDGYAEWVTNRHVLSFTMETAYETYDSDESAIGGDTDLAEIENSRYQISAGCQDAMIFDSGRWTVTPGFRVVWMEDRIKSGTDMWGDPVAAEDDTVVHPVPQIGARFQATPFLLFKANAGRFVRDPSFYERFGDRGFFIGNSDLEAETSLNVDAGMQWNLPPLASFHRVRLGVTGFYMNVDDLITRSYDSRGVGKSENVSEARMMGIETECSGSWDSWLRVSGNLTWQDTENCSETGAYDGKQLSGRFEWSGFGRLEILMEPFRWYTEYRYEDNMYYDTANLLPAKKRRELDVGLTAEWDPFLVQLDVTNVADTSYEAFNGYPLPGRAFFVSVRYRFGNDG